MQFISNHVMPFYELCIYITFSFVCSTLCYLIAGFLRPRKFPPGPIWLPVVGNTPALRKLSRKLGGQHHAFTYLANLYKTKILGLKLGKDYFVILFTEPLIRKMFTREEFQARPDSFFIRLRSMGTRKGITMTDGPLWEEQRAFAVKHLRELGFGKTIMEDLILDELHDVISKLAKGGEIQWLKILAPSVLNVLWALAAGSRFLPDDPLLEVLLQLMSERSRAFDMAGGVLSQLPWLRHIAPDFTGYNIVKTLNAKLSLILQKTIADHRKSLNKDETRDFIDAFLHEMNHSNDKPTTFTDDQLIMVCLDFFIAGSQTTSNTLDFAFLHMLLKPDIQKRVQEEIDSVLSNGKMPSLADRNRLPYTEAVLLESQRLQHVVPIAGPRRVLEDTEIEGYIIPKGATVLAHIRDFHYSNEKWGDADAFRPERFLDSDGKLVPEQLYLYSYGKRRCLGESLARNVIFLFFVGILKNYNISPVLEKSLPTLVPNPGITLSPKPYTAIIRSRFKNGN